MSNEIITEEMKQIKLLIIDIITKRELLKSEMQEWYERFPTERFSKIDNLMSIDSKLSELDSNYKRLWDFHNQRSKQHT